MATDHNFRIKNGLHVQGGTATFHSVNNNSDLVVGGVINTHDSASPARITTSSTGQLYLDSTTGQDLYLGWWNSGSANIITEMKLRAPALYDRNDTSYYVNPATSSVLNNIDMRGTSTYLPGHAYSHTHGGTNVYWHVGSASGSTNKILNLRVYKSDNSNYTTHQFLTTGANITGNLNVTGNLTVTGSIDRNSVTDLDVVDKTITVGVGQSDANSGGSGLIVAGSGAQLLWDYDDNRWEMNENFYITGHVTSGSHMSSNIFYNTGDYRTLNTAGSGWDTVIARNGGSPYADMKHSYRMNGTTVIDSSRNLSNIGTITSTSAGTILDSSQNLTNINNVYASGYRIGSTTVIDSSRNISANTYLTVGNSSTSGTLRAHYSDGSSMALEGYGLVMNRGASYIRPTTDNDKTLYIGGADASLDWLQIHFRTGTGLYMTGTRFMDSGRNLENIGTISSGVITANSGTTNVVANFISTDGTAGIKLQDSAGNVELSAAGSTFQVQPSGGAAKLTVDASGNAEATTSLRAPIFYDSDNTAYYANPAGTSVFNGATFAATPTVNGNTVLTSNAGINANNINGGTLNNDRLPNFVHLGTATTTGYATDDGSWGSRLNVSSSVHAKIEVSQEANSMRSYWYAHTGHDSIKFGTSTSHDVEIVRGGTTRIEATSGGATITGIGTATTDFRAPIFYDSSNTDFYIDPVGNSKLYGTLYLGHTNSQPGNLTIYDTGNNRLEIKGTASNTFSMDLEGTGSDGFLSITQFNVGIGASTDASHRLKVSDPGHNYLWIESTVGSNEAMTRYKNPTSNNWYTGIRNGTQNSLTNTSYHVYSSAFGATTGGWNASGQFFTANEGYALGSFRAPLFYDYNNTAFFVDPASSNSKIVGLNIHGGANNNTNDAVLYVEKTTNADWGIRINGTGSATEYGIRIGLSGGHSYGAQFLNNTAEYSRIGTDFMQHNAGVRSPKVIAGTSSVALTSNGPLAVYDTGNPYISFHTGTARTAYIQELSGRFYFGEVPYTETEGSFRAPLFYDSQNTSYYMDPQNSTFLNQLNVSKLQIDGKQVLDMPNSSTERGPWNPIASSIRNSGRKIYADEDFSDGTNGVTVYNNAGGNAVTITRVTATSDPGQSAPNSSGKVLKIAYLASSTAGSSPGFGGFYQTIPAEDNHTFVQLFQAKLPAGRSLYIAENSQGSNATSYFLTSDAGTGKWEWYARVSHCGDAGTFSGGGHIYVQGGSGDFNWYLASCTCIDVTESHLLHNRQFEASTDMRAPIFYDSADTTYYEDPASSRVLKGLTHLRPGHSSSHNETLRIGRHDDLYRYHSIFSTNNSTASILDFRLHNGGSSTAQSTVLSLFQNLSSTGDMGTLISNGTRLGFDESGTRSWTMKATGGALNIYSGDGAGHFQSTISGGFRAPIFYDTGNTGFFVNPAGSTKIEELNVFGGNNQSTNDGAIYIQKTNNNDWLLKAEGSGSGTEYGITVRMPGSSHSYSYQATNAGTEYYRVGTDMVLHNASIRSPIFYDSNNTAYYLDASSTGTSLSVAGNAIIPGYASIAGVELSSGVTRSLSGMANNQWVTIANFTGDRKQDIIEIHDDESSRHNMLKMQVAWSYGQGSIQIVNGLRHGSRTINQVRMLYNSADRTYGTGKLQVYLTNWSSSYTLHIKQQAFASGSWGKSSIPSSVEAGTPSGYTTHEGTTLEANEDNNGTFGTTGRAVIGQGIDVFHGSPIKFHTTAGDGISTERGFIDAQEGGHLRIATSGGENIVFQDGGVGGTTNLTLLGSGEMVKEATERFTIKSHSNSWDGGLRFYASDNSTIFQMHPDTNGQMYVDREWRFNGTQINYGSIRRGSHHVGHLEGSYNNIGNNGTKSNPIYTIGSSYNPTDAALGNMYGIGFTDASAGFISGGLNTGSWGMYVAADGDARVWLEASNGRVCSLGDMRSPAFYDIDNTAFFLNPSANGGNSLKTIGDWRQNTSNWSGEVAGKMQYHGNNWYIQSSANTIFRNASGVDTMIQNMSTGQMTLSGDLRLSSGANLTRLAHHSGHLEGTYNNVGSNGAKSNPIYTIGSSYNPDSNGTTLANMYGIGFTSVNAGFISSPINVGDWGMYVAADGDARIFLDGSFGHAAFAGNTRSQVHYDIDNTAYFTDLSSSTDSIVTRGTVHIGPEGNLGLGDLSHPKIAYPGEPAQWGGSGTTTGQVIIDLPGTLGNYDMAYIEIDVYEYSNQKGGSKIIIGSHNWNSGGDSGTSNTMWYGTDVRIVGRFDKEIYLGWRNNGSVNKRVIVLGTHTSSWSYGTVHVSKVSGGTYYNNSIDWTGDWNISQSTSSSAYTKSPTTNWNDSDSRNLRVHRSIQGNRVYGDADIRSPIFYDLDNTAYYTNPASTSVMSAIQLGADTNPTLTGDSVYLKITTIYGNLTVGPANTSYCHINTDRPQYYFNKKLVVDEGIIRSYDEDLQLDRGGSTTARLRITSGTTYSDQSLSVAGNIKLADNNYLELGNGNQEFYLMHDQQGNITYGDTNKNMINSEACDFFFMSNKEWHVSNTSPDIMFGYGDYIASTGTDAFYAGAGGSVKFQTVSTGIKVTGSIKIGATTVIDASRNLSSINLVKFRDNGASFYISPSNANTLNAQHDSTADTADMWINYRGYNDTFSNFRDFRIGNGKGSALLFVDGSAATFDFQNSSVLQMGGTTVIDASRNLENIVNASTSKLTLVAPTAANLECFASGTGTPTTNWRISGASSNLMTLNGSGNLTISGSLSQNSDRRIKDNIAPITDALSKICSLQGSTYTRIDEGQDTTKVHAGLIAQDVEAILPEAVGETGEGIKTIDYTGVVALLVQSIKELKAEVDELKKQLITED